MTFKDTHRIREIKMLQDSIRQKLRDIKSSSIQTQRSLEVQYKPLIDPLKQLTETVVAAKEIKQEPKEENEGEVEEEEEEVFEPEQSFGRPSLASEFDAFIRANNIGDLLGTYLQFIQTDDREEADFTYGIHYDGNEWKMGSYPVSFSDNDIIINGVEYKGTPGLFELIFKKHPQSGSFNDNDLKVYKQMLEATGVHKREDGKGIKSNRGYKYTNIISNMFPPKNKKKLPLLRASPASRKRPSQPLSPFIGEKRKKLGEGLLMEVEKSKIDYRYWDDPNELVDRLRLLSASKEAGNSGHNNEIIAILEELKEADIIKDFDNFIL